MPSMPGIPRNPAPFRGKLVARIAGEASVHQLGFADLMVALQLLGDSPGEVIVLGVQPLDGMGR